MANRPLFGHANAALQLYPEVTIRPILSTTAGRIMLAHADTAWRNAFIGTVKFPIAGLLPVCSRSGARVDAQGVNISLDRHVPDVSAVVGSYSPVNSGLRFSRKALTASW